MDTATSAARAERTARLGWFGELRARVGEMSGRRDERSEPNGAARTMRGEVHGAAQAVRLGWFGELRERVGEMSGRRDERSELNGAARAVRLGWFGELRARVGEMSGRRGERFARRASTDVDTTTSAARAERAMRGELNGAARAARLGWFGELREWLGELQAGAAGVAHG